MPRRGNYWNTQGVTCYGSGALDVACAPPRRSMGDRGGEAIDRRFMAMVCRASDPAELTGNWYDRGARAVEEKQPPDAAQLRFKAEAERVLAGAR